MARDLAPPPRTPPRPCALLLTLRQWAAQARAAVAGTPQSNRRRNPSSNSTSSNSSTSSRSINSSKRRTARGRRLHRTPLQCLSRMRRPASLTNTCRCSPRSARSQPTPQRPPTTALSARPTSGLRGKRSTTATTISLGTMLAALGQRTGMAVAVEAQAERAEAQVAVADDRAAAQCRAVPTVAAAAVRGVRGARRTQTRMRRTSPGSSSSRSQVRMSRG
mmetsp:Transcript_33645/g.88777  ORF Transcript_33645/g.88777 Transcript_33645/m.88777 type:complete len:220 (+) Transcript_33645:605-1264(+)